MFLLGRSSGDAKVTVARVVEGAQPYEAFKTAIDEILAGK
jgi:predicted DsbA family dithiol-disulfide isomerase